MSEVGLCYRLGIDRDGYCQRLSVGSTHVPFVNCILTRNTTYMADRFDVTRPLESSISTQEYQNKPFTILFISTQNASMINPSLEAVGQESTDWHARNVPYICLVGLIGRTDNGRNSAFVMKRQNWYFKYIYRM